MGATGTNFDNRGESSVAYAPMFNTVQYVQKYVGYTTARWQACMRGARILYIIQNTALSASAERGMCILRGMEYLLG